MNYTLYSKPGCSFCVKAKDLLSSKNLPYQEIVLDMGQEIPAEKTKIAVDFFKSSFPTVRTLPLILVDGHPLGGFTELRASLV